MDRKKIFFVVVLAALAVCWGRATQAGEHLTAEMMKAALKTTDAEEDGFIEAVLKAVDSGILSEELVQSTFLWARRKPKNKFQYFKYGLLQRIKDQEPIPK